MDAYHFDLSLATGGWGGAKITPVIEEVKTDNVKENVTEEVDGKRVCYAFLTIKCEITEAFPIFF